MSVLPIASDPGDRGDHPLVRIARENLHMALAFAALEQKVQLLAGQQDQLSQKVDQVTEAIDRRDRFLPIIPEIEKLDVAIPESMKAQVGKECKPIAKALGDDPTSRLKEGIGRFDVITYPRELVGPIARRWFAIHRNNPQRADWFKKQWTIKAPPSQENVSSPETKQCIALRIREAKDLIMESLRKGPQESNKILDQMDQRGIPNQIWIEAKSQLGVMVKQASNGRLIWSLPKK